MKSLLFKLSGIWFVSLAFTGAFPAFSAEEKYPLTADSQRQEGVPEGKVHGPFAWQSTIFPGTERNYWLYVPAQYDGTKPACQMIVQDGLNRASQWRLPIVLDNLIHQGAVPVTIGIFIDPGVVPAEREGAEARYNRSYEYDGLGDRYARFLLEEILPEVGKTYRLSEDPNDRLIAGASSGAICAFNAAWERPDTFRRVLSTIGTYVGLRGGNAFPVLVRKTEPKPLRVFLQDGSADLDIYGGSWWAANQDMLAALQWADYEVKHVWGDGGHDHYQATSIMPDALRWLWKDYPQPVKAGVTAQRRTNILIPGEDWEMVAEGYRFTEGPAVNPYGEIFFTDIPNNRIYKIDAEGTVSLFAEETGGANGLMFGPGGKLYACANRHRAIVAYRADGSVKKILAGVESNDLVIDRAGRIYFTDPGNQKVHLIDVQGNHHVVDEGIERPNGIAMSPDQTMLYVADTRGQFVYSFQIQSDDSLAYKEPFFHLHLAPGATDSGADGMAMDTQGRLYVTTRSGLQVCDQLGRVHLILPRPQNAWLSNVVFAGPNLDTLYITCGDKVYRRRVNATGVVPTREPVQPPKPRL